MYISTNLGLLGLAMLGSSMAASPAQAGIPQMDYHGSMKALSYGNIPMDNQPKVVASGEIHFSIKDYPTEKLPHLKQDVGMYTMDNLETLKVIVQLGQEAGKQGRWGDLVFLHNAFSMNAHLNYAKVVSPEMREGLLKAVTKTDKSGVDVELIELYVQTSTSPALAAAFNDLRTTPVTSELAARGDLSARGDLYDESCSFSHRANKRECQALLGNVQLDVSIRTGEPRSICNAGCCISWSVNATFKTSDLFNPASYCYNACGFGSVSCKIFGLDLEGTIVNECLSNRPDGCG
ncbi:hypothetical protein E4U21_007117 [Claviceps maximensis]|nr:hypothetical protein E4U21_007117 [Claviceps maximensis]